METNTLIYRLWAKTNDYDRRKADVRGEDVPDWARHPLPLHLLDVGLVAEAWLEADGALLRRFGALWPDAEREAMTRALVLTAASHDLGKAYPKFQSKSDEGWAHGYGAEGMARPDGGGFDHGAYTGRLFHKLAEPGRSGPSGVDPAWRTLWPLVRVGAGHHGTLYADDGIRADARAWYGALGRTVRALLDELAHHFGAPLRLPPDPPPAFLLLVAGFVSVADWLGSNTDFFPPAPEVTSRAEAEAYRRERAGAARRSLEKAGLFAESAAPTDFAELFSPEGQRWTPRAGFQAEACRAPFGQEPGAEMVVVEAPMGLGKTEIALFLVAQALRAGTASGLYFALPTQATSDALFARVEDFAGRIKAEGSDLALVLAHGSKRYFERYRALVDRSRKSAWMSARRAGRGDPAPPSEVVAPAWVQPSKRALLAPIGLGTIDQALLGAMGVKHGFVRLFGLAGKVVVFDEVHAYDAYMGVLLKHLLAWLGALGAKVILLSATLPSGLREELLRAYGVADVGAPEAYPQLLHAAPPGPRMRAPITDPNPGATAPKPVRVEPLEVAGDADARTAAGVAWTAQKAALGGGVAWIRNTVREAQQAYEALRAAGVEAELLHARFTRHDRSQKEKSLLERFGPPAPINPKRPSGRVVVATQVIEQSVDVDFDAMLSDLAPVDLLLQRAGRLWRHERAGQRHGHSEAALGVLMPDAGGRARLDFGNSVYVYDAETLARSARLVLEHPVWALPDACRTLVAELYDRGRDYWTAERLSVEAERLGRARERFAARLARMEHAARTTLLTPPAQTPVTRAVREDRSDGGEHVALVTRYGAHSAAAVLFRTTPRGPVPVGADEPLEIPADDEYGERLDVEEAVALATVRFPWYGEHPPDAAPPDALADLHAWWRETHPFDDRFLLLLGDGGSFAHPYVEGRYSAETGLLAQRTDATPPARENAPLDAL